MASMLLFKCWFSFVALLCTAITCSINNFVNYAAADGNPADVIGRALECFNDHYVYSSCQESYRLSAEGHINVPVEAVDQYCGGPCLAETRLVLSCVDSILYNFRFYNGASIRDVRYTLHSGCGYGSRRGDFDTFENLGAGDYYGHGGKQDAPAQLMIMLIWTFVLLLLLG